MDAYVIDSGVLKKNLQICRECMAGTPIWAAVKGDGYGLGLEAYARVLMEEGFERFVVSETAEALRLRALGFEGDILLLRSVTERRELEELLENDIVLTLGSLRAYGALELAARRRGLTARAHLYVDSGMGWEGFTPGDKSRLLALWERGGAVTLEGLYTHFPAAWGPAEDTIRRFGAFMKLVSALKAGGFQGQCHCAASGAALRFPEMRLDAVRLGSALLGRVPGEAGRTLGLRPVGYIDAGIAAIHAIGPGQSLGYAGAFTAKRKTRVAVLEVGYYHGYDTERCRDLIGWKDCLRAMLSPLRSFLQGEKRTALVAGREVEVLGQVSMHHTLLDVTDCPCRVGDRAILPCNPLMVRNLPRLFL